MSSSLPNPSNDALRSQDNDQKPWILLSPSRPSSHLLPRPYFQQPRCLIPPPCQALLTFSSAQNPPRPLLQPSRLKTTTKKQSFSYLSICLFVCLSILPLTDLETYQVQLGGSKPGSLIQAPSDSGWAWSHLEICLTHTAGKVMQGPPLGLGPAPWTCLLCRCSGSCTGKGPVLSSVLCCHGLSGLGNFF